MKFSQSWTPVHPFLLRQGLIDPEAQLFSGHIGCSCSLGILGQKFLQHLFFLYYFRKDTCITGAICLISQN